MPAIEMMLHGIVIILATLIILWCLSPKPPEQR